MCVCVGGNYRYSPWLQAHPEHLTVMFGFLMEGFASPKVMAAAATAIKVRQEKAGGLQKFGDGFFYIHRTL